MSEKTLFLAWQDKARTREWFPVGRLDVQKPKSLYRFRYLHGAERAHQQAGFEPLYDFPDFHQRYEASDLFPLFQNRVIAPGRRDFRDYLSTSVRKYGDVFSGDLGESSLIGLASGGAISDTKEKPFHRNLV
jgi:hypothetical protein